MKGGYCYLMSNRPNGTLYVGVTADLARRVWEHRNGVGSVFVRRYGLVRLVYWEAHDDIRSAIQRETNVKYWPRAWKVRLLERMNPAWKDLYPALMGLDDQGPD
ncbi:MAG: GIY-YIG nuclease family protein [Acetobacteraceae bacterium]|nr:GIY-YIG nuclease family protein [Pseudomonadota bacterium]